ncbi:unnamed protein product [Wuchereria bancrofti]|uniref:Uncharacterized protein n=1 Tax=Wuchereria bancrofti TaxID=6293 RepID=A0A3P7E9C6_WUCBA|nr:unnamed protein product [Wuchereria bancrofti]
MSAHGTRTFAEILLGNVPSATRETNFSGEDVENGSTGEIREEFKGLKKANLTQRKKCLHQTRILEGLKAEENDSSKL